MNNDKTIILFDLQLPEYLCENTLHKYLKDLHNIFKYQHILRQILHMKSSQLSVDITDNKKNISLNKLTVECSSQCFKMWGVPLNCTHLNCTFISSIPRFYVPVDWCPTTI